MIAAATIHAEKIRRVDMPICIPCVLATLPMIAGATMAPILVRKTKNPIQTGYLEKISPALETDVPNIPDIPRPMPTVAMISPAGEFVCRSITIKPVVIRVSARIIDLGLNFVAAAEQSSLPAIRDIQRTDVVNWARDSAMTPVSIRKLVIHPIKEASTA